MKCAPPPGLDNEKIQGCTVHFKRSIVAALKKDGIRKGNPKSDKRKRGGRRNQLGSGRRRRVWELIDEASAPVHTPCPFPLSNNAKPLGVG